MLYILWGLVNICLFIFFIVCCYRATGLLNNKFGPLSAFIFVLGILGVMGSNNEQNNKVNTNAISLMPKDSVWRGDTYSKSLDADKSFVASYHAFLKYGIDPLGNAITIEMNATELGITCGTKWKPQYATINAGSKKKRIPLCSCRGPKPGTCFG